MARPAHKPDPTVRHQVEAMAGYGVPEAEIAGVVGVSPKTLRKHYRGELDHGHVKANAKVAENLYRKATGEGREAVIAAIFWLKTRAGWKETSVQELAARDDKPLVIFRTIVEPPPRRDDILELRPVSSQPVPLIESQKVA
jgi:hypothetical protein